MNTFSKIIFLLFLSIAIKSYFHFSKTGISIVAEEFSCKIIEVSVFQIKNFKTLSKNFHFITALQVSKLQIFGLIEINSTFQVFSVKKEIILLPEIQGIWFAISVYFWFLSKILFTLKVAIFVFSS